MTLEGGDESQWQGAVDWNAVETSGRAFEICKATEGNGYVDPRWANNRAGMLRIGIVPGAYHFSRPDLGNPPDVEAEFWLSVVNPGPGWLLAHDAESAGGSLAWCDEFEQHCAMLLGGYHIWLYSYLNWLQARGIVGSDLLTRSPLWLAWPDANGPLPLTASMQQYGAGGLTGGDLNRFFGDASQLAALTLGGSAMSVTDDLVVRINREVGYDDSGSLTAGGVADTLLQGKSAWQQGVSQQLAALLSDEGVEKAAIDALAANGAAAAQVGALKTELDAVQAALQAGGPADLTKVYAELQALGKHVGVDVTTGADT